VKETCDMEKKTDKTELKESEIMTPLKAKTCYVLLHAANNKCMNNSTEPASVSRDRILQITSFTQLH